MPSDRPSIDNSTRARRIAIVGGGLSGLSAAFRLGELSQAAGLPVKSTLFEASDRLGGVVRTEQIDDYLVEMCSDSFITNKPWAVDLCRRLALGDQLIETDATYRRSLVLRKGRPVPVPDGFMLLSPAKAWPVVTSPIFSPWGKLRMGMEYFLPRRSESDDESLASFVRRRFGREALERLVQPLVGGIYTSDPERLSLRATMPRFIEMERRYGSLIRASRRTARSQNEAERNASGARYGLFLSLLQGMSQLVDALAARVTELCEVRMETPIATIEPASAVPRQWKLTPSNGPTETFDALILATPAHHAGRLVSPFDSALSELLCGIEHASTAIVVSGHRLDDVTHPLDAFGLVVPAVERRNILAVSFASRKFAGRAPNGRVILRTFMGGALQPELLQQTDDELLLIAQRELADILGVQGQPDFAKVARYTNAMPQYHIGHLDRITRIEQLAAQHANFALAGNAYHGVGIPDCVHSGEQAAERILNVAHG